VILVDANLLIYAVNADSAHHAAARHWLESNLSTTTEVGFSWIVLLAFLRITTRKGIFASPLTSEEAVAYVDDWLDQPFARVVVPGERHWSILRHLLAATGSAGNLTSDAHLAALAIEQRASVASTDADFRRFRGVEYVNPLEGAAE
jgi:toxin-antitoxin system PIN domain toxin